MALTTEKELLQRHIELRETLSDINVSLATIKTDVHHHIRRTENLETRYDALNSEYLRLDRQLSKWAGATALSGWVVSTILALAALLLKFI